MYTYINWYFNSVIVTFRKFIKNFLNIMRFDGINLLDILKKFIPSMTSTTPNSFISNLLVKIFLVNLIM
jgi:hypothetical protein